MALLAVMLITATAAPDAFSRERKTRKQQPARPVDLGLFKPNAIAPIRFAVHDRGLQWLLMSNWGELGNPDDRPAGPPTPFHPSSSLRNSKLEYPGGTGTRFLFTGGLWVGAIKNGVRIVSTVTDGDNGTQEVGQLSTWLYQSTDVALKENDDDGDWTIADDRNGDGNPSNDYDGPNTDANHDGVLNYDPEPHIDEDLVGDMSADFLDNDFDSLIDEADPDKDGDVVPGSFDDDGDGKEDEDTNARGAQEWFTAYADTCRDCLASPDVDGFTPLGVRIVQHTYQWPETFRDDFLILEYFVTNIGNEVLNDVWLATFFDFDAQIESQGTAGSEDDITFFIDSIGTAIGGDDDGDGMEAQFFGVRVLKTPRPGAGFSYLNFERISGGDPTDNLQKYEKMSSGQRDADQFINGDWRFLFSFGPLGDVAPGETLPVTLAIVNGGRAGLSTEENIALIAQNSTQALALFENDFRGPAAPDAPNFTVEALDRAVRITWDARAENSVDPISKTADFDGYRIWRSLDGVNFTVLADYDAINGVGFDRGLPPKNAQNLYELTDRGVPPLVQLKYVVTAYDNGDNGDGINHPEVDRATGGVSVLENSLGVTRQKTAVANSATQTTLDNIYVVPNPYKGSSEFEQFGRFDAEGNRTFPKVIQFVNLPEQATIQIFTLAGDLVQTLEHNNTTGVEVWNLTSRLRQEIVGGIYIYRVAANGQEKIGKFVVVK
jgi:hypothetical protein